MATATNAETVTEPDLSPPNGGGGQIPSATRRTIAPTAGPESVEPTIPRLSTNNGVSARADGLDQSKSDDHQPPVETEETDPAAAIPLVPSSAGLPPQDGCPDQRRHDDQRSTVGVQDAAGRAPLDTLGSIAGGETRKRGQRAPGALPSAAPLALPDLHGLLRHYAQTTLDFQQARIAMGNRVGAIERDGFDPVWSAPVGTAADDMERAERALQRKLEQLAGMHPLAPWIAATPGLGLLGFALILGATGPLDAFPNVAKLWAYCGLDVKSDGRAPRRVKGVKLTPREKGGEGAHSPQARMVCYRIGEAFVKCATSPYRRVYLDAKAVYTSDAGNHVRRGPSSCPFGQVHLKDGKQIACGLAHAHAAARRVAVKRFLADLWEEWRRGRE
jgi:hypothetical protein